MTGADIKRFYSQCCSNDISLAESQQWVKLAAMDDVNDDFMKKIFEGELKNGQVHDGYYFDVAKKLTDAVSKGLKIKGLSSDSPQTRMFEKFRNNIYAFSAAKSLTVLQEYSKALTDESGKRRSYNGFRNATIEVGQQFNDDHFRTEYNSAIAKAQMGAKWDRLRGYHRSH